MKKLTKYQAQQGLNAVKRKLKHIAENAPPRTGPVPNVG